MVADDENGRVLKDVRGHLRRLQGGGRWLLIGMVWTTVAVVGHASVGSVEALSGLPGIVFFGALAGVSLARNRWDNAAAFAVVRKALAGREHLAGLRRLGADERLRLAAAVIAARDRCDESSAVWYALNDFLANLAWAGLPPPSRCRNYGYDISISIGGFLAATASMFAIMLEVWPVVWLCLAAMAMILVTALRLAPTSP